MTGENSGPSGSHTSQYACLRERYKKKAPVVYVLTNYFIEGADDDVSDAPYHINS